MFQRDKKIKQSKLNQFCTFRLSSGLLEFWVESHLSSHNPLPTRSLPSHLLADNTNAWPPLDWENKIAAWLKAEKPGGFSVGLRRNTALPCPIFFINVVHRPDGFNTPLRTRLWGRQGVSSDSILPPLCQFPVANPFQFPNCLKKNLMSWRLFSVMSSIFVLFVFLFICFWLQGARGGG